jgi:phosphoribosylformimino-5-aminoimidazole carboxamide ribotide isomerase
MRLFPAIDLKEGRCVRLRQGDMAQATIYADDPAAQAKAFEDQGFDYLHVVDLDGAFAGKPVNASAVEAIRAATSFPVQLGGGIRDMKTVEGWLSKSVTRVVKAAARAFPGRVAVGIDARDGWVAVEGWAETSTLHVQDLARRFEDAGVAAVVYTNIARDGMLSGIDWDGTIALADAVSIPVVASGGLASLDDVRELISPRAKKLEGAITGKALYDGRLDPAEAMALIRQARAA